MEQFRVQVHRGWLRYRLYFQAWEISFEVKNPFIKKTNEAQELIVEKGGEMWE